MLAHSVEARYVYADPTRVKDPAGDRRGALPAARHARLGAGRADEAAQAARTASPSQFEYLARGVDIAEAKQIAALDLAGIGVHRDERREVPGDDLAANLIGFTGQDMDRPGGPGGALRRAAARAQDGKRIYEVGQGDLAAPIPGGYQPDDAGQAGQLAAADHRPGPAVRGAADPRPADGAGQGAASARRWCSTCSTGEVLAQASYPTYDAANPEPSKPTDREDAATSFVVDPGSVHKAITFGAALQEGVITPDSTFAVGRRDHQGRRRLLATPTRPTGTADEHARA